MLLMSNSVADLISGNKEPVPGTSRKRKKFRKTEEEEVIEDVKELTDCIVRNSLNKVDDEPVMIEEQRVVALPGEMNAEIVEDVPIVANGDVANNNRDIEGNNCIAEVNEIRVVEDENIQNVGE